MKFSYWLLCLLNLCCALQCQLPNSESLSSAENALIPQKSYYSTGELKSEFFINQDSLKEDIFREYTPDGKLTRSIDYKQGQIHGIYATFSSFGDTLSRHHYQEGLPNGTFRWYWPNGQIWQEGRKLGGHIHGTLKEFYESGRLKYLTNYNHGKKYEACLGYFSDGRLQQFIY